MLRMGIVGLGMGGSYGPVLHNSKLTEFSAICDINPEKLAMRLKAYKAEIGAEPKGYLSVAEMIKKEGKLDGVIIGTPSGFHHQSAIDLANAGINILIDKPLDVSMENIAKIKAAVEKNKVLCGIIYPLRCQPVMSGVKQALTKGLIGRPLICDARLKWHRAQEYYDKGGWRGTWKIDGGASLMNNGAHAMDILCWFMGRVKTVSGEFAILNHKMETEDWTSASLSFESGARGTVSTTTCVTPKTDSTWLEIHGTTGSIYIKDGKVVSSSVENLETLAPSAFPHPVDDFIDAVSKKREPMINIAEASKSVELINAIYQSSREGKRVVLS